MVSGTPSATPDADPKLLVMSLRTIPLSVRMLPPVDPSPGWGPAVSSGIELPSDAVPAEVLAPAEPPASPSSLPVTPHPARTTASPVPPATPAPAAGSTGSAGHGTARGRARPAPRRGRAASS